MIPSRAFALLLCAGVLACSGATSQSPYGSITGMVFDQAGDAIALGSPAEGDTISYRGANCAGNGQQATLAMVLSVRAGYCTAMTANAALASNEALVLQIVGVPGMSGGAEPVIAPGLYALGGQLTGENGNLFTANVTLALFDSACGQRDLFAASGSITLAALGASGEAQGAFDVHFDGDPNGSGGDLTGWFDTFSCAVGAAQLCPSGTAACEP